MQKNNTAIFAVHRKNLITQTAATFDQFDIPHGFIAAGRPYDASHTTHIASIETLRRRLNKVPIPKLLVVDEAHLSCSRTWSEVINHYKTAGTRILGLTATPARADGKPLGDLYGEIVSGPPVRTLMDEGYLSDYAAYAPSTPDLTGVRTRAGDYARDELEAAMAKPRLTGDAAAHYLKLAAGTRAVAYCVSIAHSKKVAEHFSMAGIPAAHIDGTTPRDEQRRIIAAFADGEYSVLCNVDLLTTGFDLSAQVGREVPIETVIMLRATQSETLHLQALGRGLRKKPRPAIILDHSGNIARLGFPDDERTWSLEGRPARTKSEPTVAIRQCSECFFIHKPAPACPKCGYEYPVQSREIEQVDGELQLLDRKAARKAERAEERAARTYAQLVELAAKRGYSSPNAFATKRLVGRAKSMGDMMELARDSGKDNPGAWAGFMWNTVKKRMRRHA